MENGKKPPQEILLGEIAGTLRAIKGWVTFLGIVVLVGVLIGGCLMTASSFAGTGSIITSFKSPCRYVESIGIDYHAGYLYHGDYRWGMIIKTTMKGSVVQTISAPYAGTGLDRTNIEFWACRADIIHRLDTTGSLMRSIYTPDKGYGVAYGEGFLWFTATNNHIYKLTVNGLVVSSFRFSGHAPRGICYRNQELWLADLSTRRGIDQVTVSGSFIESYRLPQRPWDVTCEGQYIWYSGYVNGWVYKMLPIPYGTAVAPASLGRIKALF